MTTSSIRKIWELIKLFKKEVELLMNDEALVLLIYLSRHEGIIRADLIGKIRKHFSQPEKLVEFLLSNKFIEEKNGMLSLLQKGKGITKIIEYSQYDISKLPKEIIPGYVLQAPPLGKGSTSITFKAIKGDGGPDVVLKIFKPGIFDHINFWKKIKEINILESLYLVTPYHCGEYKWNDITLKYVEMKYIAGLTLKKFLDNNVNIDLKETLKNFIEEVGRAIEMIQDKGLTHGDLHENNILVVEDESYKGRYHFKIIDFIGINPNKEFFNYELTDFEYFRDNFLKIVRKYAPTPSGEVDIKKLGERLSYIYENLTNKRYTAVKDVRKGLSEKLPEKEKLPTIEQPFTYLIFEEYDLNEPLWIRRFEPDPIISSYFRDFRSLICSGPRGCGKTIYLRSLSFVPRLIKVVENEPDLKEKITFFKGIFGIYFACRQGEFKIFSKETCKFTFDTQLFIKHIFILKIIRKVVGLVDVAYSEGIFDSKPDFTLVKDFISPYLTRDIYLTLSATKRPFKEMETILRNEEMECLNILGKEEKYPPKGKLLNEKVLEDFFRIIQEVIRELSNVKFYVIFDDISEPQVSPEAQEILNCLMAAHNPVYCCKFSVDKYAYTFKDMFGKALQVPHDYTYLDLSIGLEPYDLYTDKFYTNYLKKIINRQLEMGGYKVQIEDCLDKLPYSHQELTDLLSQKDYEKAKFAGWDLIVQLSSRTVRDALVICDEIIIKQYENYQQSLKDENDKISVDVQDQAMRKYSRNAYRNLMNIEYKGKEIFVIVKDFGEISKHFLNKPITDDPGRHLFDIEITFKKDFEGGKITNEIRNKFAENGYPLYIKAKISKIDNLKWRIDDKKSREPRFIIQEKKDNKIYVYASRKYELISIERRDEKNLSDSAEEMVSMLIRHSVFIDRGLSFSREQIGLVQKFTLHKKYTPALMTTWREREHLRLSKDELEEFLLNPDQFRDRILKKDERDKYQLKLWDFERGEENE